MCYKSFCLFLSDLRRLNIQTDCMSMNGRKSSALYASLQKILCLRLFSVFMTIGLKFQHCLYTRCKKLYPDSPIWRTAQAEQ